MPIAGLFLEDAVEFFLGLGLGVYEGLFGRLAGLDLAAGELPQPRHGLIGPSLTDQDFAVAHD